MWTNALPILLYAMEMQHVATQREASRVRVIADSQETERPVQVGDLRGISCFAISCFLQWTFDKTQNVLHNLEKKTLACGITDFHGSLRRG